MKKREIRKRIALILCAALMAGIVDLPGNCPISVAAQSEAGEFQIPPGGLETVEVYPVTDPETVQKVPSYETGASFFSRRSQTVFEMGTGDYGYQHLNAAQQKFYDDVDVSLKNFRADADARFTEDGGDYVPFKVEYDTSALETDEMVAAWMAFRADHPWLFWFSNSLKVATQGSKEFFIPVVGEMYKQGPETVEAMEQTVTDGVQKYLDAAAQANGRYEKVRVIYDQIIGDINYAYKSDGTTPEDADWAHSIVGVLDGTHKKAVCEGYAKAFCFILNILDIPNVYVTGYAGGGHAWNAVSFDGGNTYYYMDATWDDQGGKNNNLPENTYMYFAMPKDAFEKKHTPDKGGTGINWQYDLPEMGNEMDYTYFVRFNGYGTSDAIRDRSSAEEFLKAAKVLAPQETCLFLLKNDTILQTLAGPLGVTGSVSYVPVSEYDMIFYTATADKFTSKTPAAEIAFSEETVRIDVQPGESKVQTLEIGAVTDGSDDYITFYSEDEDRAVVKTPYVKAKQGERVEVVIKEAGSPVRIFAKSVKGGAEAFCTVITEDEPEPTPTIPPTIKPTVSPTATLTATPTVKPTIKPTVKPTVKPSDFPTALPTDFPTALPTDFPTALPTDFPTAFPTALPTALPTIKPTVTPTVKPTIAPTATPTVKPTATPTIKPTVKPTTGPVIGPTIKPSALPTALPTVKPTTGPVIGPTIKPTALPTALPTAIPTDLPTTGPVIGPTIKPSAIPTDLPTTGPVIGPTIKPSALPTALPTTEPIIVPTAIPVVPAPTSAVVINPSGSSNTTPTGSSKPAVSDDEDEDDDEYDEDEAEDEDEYDIEKGDEIQVGNLKYRVTKIKGEKGELAVIGVKSKNSRLIVIPKKVKKEGVSFTVTSIYKNAFKGCRKVKLLTIKSTNIKNIARKAFDGLGKKVKIRMPKVKSKVYRKLIKGSGFKLKGN